MPHLPALAAGFACDERDNHRQPIDHYWRLLDNTLSDTARLAATAPDYSDFSPRLRPDLCGLDQLVTDARHAWHYGRFRKVRQSHISLRHRRLGDDADDLGTLVHRYARDLGLEPRYGGRDPRRLHACPRGFIEEGPQPRRVSRA